MAYLVHIVILLLFTAVQIGAGKSVNLTLDVSTPTERFWNESTSLPERSGNESMSPETFGNESMTYNGSEANATIKYLIPIAAMRWIPGGFSVGIFLFFTIGTSIHVYLDKEEEEKKPDMPDVSGEADFFKIDVIGKLKTGKKNIFQRRLMQNKQKKFGVYEKMMRGYKDKIIAKRSHDQRLAEIQKEKEEKERQKEAEIAAAKAKAIMEHRAKVKKSKQAKAVVDAANVQSVSSTDDAPSRNDSYEMGQTSVDSSNRTPTPSDGSGTDNLLSPTNMPVYEAIESDENLEESDEGIVLRVKPRDERRQLAGFPTDMTAETQFMPTDSSEELQRPKKMSLDVPTLIFQSTEESDDSGESTSLQSTSQQKPTPDSSGDETATTLLPRQVRKLKQGARKSKSFDDGTRRQTEVPSRDGSEASGGDTGDEERDVITPLKNRPFSWFGGSRVTDFDRETPEEVQEGATPPATSSSQDGDKKKIDSMLERFVQNALESRGLVDEEGEPSDGKAAETKKKFRPRTWSEGVDNPSYGAEGHTDSITELIAKFMDLGPAPTSPSERTRRRRSRPLSYDQKDEEKMLVELERRIIESIHEEQEGEMPMADVLVLERLINEYTQFYKDY